MHYVVDGYNLLFQGAFKSTHNSLEEARLALIHNLDLLAEKLSLQITVVFDAPFQSDDLRRSHYNFLEIIFTSKGQTADEFIVEYVESRNEKLLVVTSDKGLLRRVKGPNVYTEKVLDFLQRIRKKAGAPPKKKLTPTPTTKKPETPKKALDMKNLPPLSDIPAWEHIFLDQLKKGPKSG